MKSDNLSQRNAVHNWCRREGRSRSGAQFRPTPNVPPWASTRQAGSHAQLSHSLAYLRHELSHNKKKMNSLRVWWECPGPREWRSEITYGQKTFKPKRATFNELWNQNSRNNRNFSRQMDSFRLHYLKVRSWQHVGLWYHTNKSNCKRG